MRIISYAVDFRPTSRTEEKDLEKSWEYRHKEVIYLHGVLLEMTEKNGGHFAHW